MKTTRTSAQRRSLRALTTTFGLALLTAVLLSGTAMAVDQAGLAKGARLGRPTPVAPSGTISTATPTFKWTRVAGAASYEVRVYKGSGLLLRKSGISRPSWKSSTALPTTVGLTWKVRASRAAGAGAWSRTVAFRVVTPSPAKAITAFSFATPAATGVINEALHTIAVTVPAGTDLTALVPTITITGVSVSPASGTPNDFTGPATYTVTAGDGSTQAYTVTVTVAPPLSPAKAITAFSFATPAATGVINETLHTIAVTVPAGTDLTALVPTITISGVSVSPASGVPRDFTNPVTYTVTAEDGSTQAYTVTVTQRAEVQISSFAFSPKTLTVKRGTTVVWTNNDNVPHTVTSVDSLDLSATPTGLFNSGTMSRGQTFSFTFTTSGTFFYECRIHSGDAGMHAQVIVE